MHNHSNCDHSRQVRVATMNDDTHTWLCEDCWAEMSADNERAVG